MPGYAENRSFLLLRISIGGWRLSGGPSRVSDAGKSGWARLGNMDLMGCQQWTGLVVDFLLSCLDRSHIPLACKASMGCPMDLGNRVII
jgi:hypothetical protein